MLEIKNLHVEIEGTKILNGVNLKLDKGKIHAIMGPNGSGKSTLAQVIAGRETFDVTGGEIIYEGNDLLDMAPEERAREGVFMAFQYPVEIPGVSNSYFLRTALNEIRKHRGLETMDAADFLSIIKEKAKLLNINTEMLNRSVNEGFSGGEKKRNEILQLAVLEPKLGILDETDSGLDIDALKIVAEGVNALRSSERSFIIVTHYQRILDYITPDKVHIFLNGKVIRSGDKSLALDLEEKGYDGIRKEYKSQEVGAEDSV